MKTIAMMMVLSLMLTTTLVAVAPSASAIPCWIWTNPARVECYLDSETYLENLEVIVDCAITTVLSQRC